MTDADVMPEAEWEGLGVPHFDRRVYLEALRHPDAGVTGWAEGLGAEPGRVRGAAERLLDLGLLRRTVEGRPRLEPVDPRLAMRAAVRQRQERVDRFAATAGELAEELSVVYEHGRLRARPSRILEVIEGTGAAAARVAELLAGAEWEACGIDAPPYVTASGNGAATGPNTDCSTAASASALSTRPSASTSPRNSRASWRRSAAVRRLGCCLPHR